MGTVTHTAAVMRSRAAARFSSLHPDSHHQFRELLQTAHKRKLETSMGTEVEEEVEVEVANMLRNKLLTQFRQETDAMCMERKLIKTISWSPVLVMVQVDS